MTPPRRVVVVGAGAIGAAVGGLLHQARVPVLLVARGAHGEAMEDRGLDLATPAGHRRVRVPVIDSLDEAEVTPTDLLILATMGQDGAEPLGALDRRVVVASFQNGTAPLDALASSGFPTIAAMVYVPAERRAPGQVVLAGEPHPGTILLGPWGSAQPRLLAWSAWLAKQLVSAGFRAEAEPGIAPWIRAKLLINLGGVVAAVCDAPVEDVVAAAQREALAVYEAGGDSVESVGNLLDRVGPLTAAAVDGIPRAGGSTRHALARIHAGGPGTLETTSLHAPIVAGGLRHEVPTPVNTALVALAERAVAERWAPGCLSADEVRAAVGLA